MNELKTSQRRYVVTIDFYIFAENDFEAAEKAKEFSKKIDLEYDNKCKVTEIGYQPESSSEYRIIKK